MLGCFFAMGAVSPPTEHNEFRPFQSVGLPFSGPGEVWVTKEGILHFAVGTGAQSPPNSQTREIVSIEIPEAPQLCLRNAGGIWTISNVEGENALPNVRIPFDGRDRFSSPSKPILYLKGLLHVSPGEERETWNFLAENPDGTEFFLFLYRPALREWKETPGANVLEARAGGGNTCQADCEGGSCTATCPPGSDPSCVCYNGNPNCGCTTRLPSQNGLL